MTDKTQDALSNPAGEAPSQPSPASSVPTSVQVADETSAQVADETSVQVADETSAQATGETSTQATTVVPEDTIEIEGQKIPVDSLVFLVRHGINTCQIHASITGELGQTTDEVMRAYQAAAFFSSNTAASIGEQVLLCIASGDGALVKLAMQVGGRMNKRHEEFWKDYNACRDGDPPTLPGDLDTRRQGLRARMDAVNALVASASAAVESLADDSSLKASARLALQLVQVAQREATSSVEFALGNFKLEISDEQLKEAVESFKLQLMVLMGKTEAEAMATIDARLGATDADKKAFMVNAQLSKLAANSEGSLNGSLLSGEQELSVVELGVALLTIFMV